MARPALRFTLDDASEAGEGWRFNCGPASLCAALGMTPAEVRPHMLDFERKGYTNPTLMLGVLRALKVPHSTAYRSDEPDWLPRRADVFGPRLGLVRVQWGGPWCGPGVPMAARYRHTHWVAAEGAEVFDVNAMCVGGWLPYGEWAGQLVPWLIREAVPRADGLWWPTHRVEILEGDHG